MLLPDWADPVRLTKRALIHDRLSCCSTITEIHSTRAYSACDTRPLSFLHIGVLQRDKHSNRGTSALIFRFHPVRWEIVDSPFRCLGHDFFSGAVLLGIDYVSRIDIYRKGIHGMEFEDLVSLMGVKANR